MTNQNKYSRLLHIATIFCFLLPFFQTGCNWGPSAAERRAAENKRIQDSIENAQKYSDSTDLNLNNSHDTIEQSDTPQVDTVNEQVSINNADTVHKKVDKKSDYLSEEIVKKYEFLSPILIPKEDIHTGLATVIDIIPYIPQFSIFISFVLLIISFIIKFVDVESKKTFIGLLDSLALIFLVITQSAFIFSETLWGYWVCLTALFLLTIYDLYLIWLDKRLTK